MQFWKQWIGGLSPRAGLYGDDPAYGPFTNEELLGEALAPVRRQVVIGLFNQHRVDPDVPIEDVADTVRN